MWILGIIHIAPDSLEGRIELSKGKIETDHFPNQALTGGGYIILGLVSLDPRSAVQSIRQRSTP
jgi:hypothetical protein